MDNAISVVLVEPQGEWNIGSVARAMSNCGLRDLRLVRPVPFKTENAFLMACNAKELLLNAREYGNLDEAIFDCDWSVGFTRRGGKERRTPVDYHEIVSSFGHYKRVALVFGREADGLTNDELSLCSTCAYIPSSADYPSFNLSHAVILACHACFEVGSSRDQGRVDEPFEQEWITLGELEDLMRRLDRSLEVLDYDNSDCGRLRETILHNIRMIFNRSQLKQKEYRMFQGLVTRIIEKCGYE